eukprot:scaffold55095_cov17-Tisochrysis_lutea.AAC.1
MAVAFKVVHTATGHGQDLSGYWAEGLLAPVIIQSCGPGWSLMKEEGSGGSYRYNFHLQLIVLAGRPPSG